MPEVVHIFDPSGRREMIEQMNLLARDERRIAIGAPSAEGVPPSSSSVSSSLSSLHQQKQRKQQDEGKMPSALAGGTPTSLAKQRTAEALPWRLGGSRFNGRALAKMIGRADWLHVWSLAALPTAMCAACKCGAKMMLSLPCAPQAGEMKLLARYSRDGLYVAVPTTADAAAMTGTVPKCHIDILPPAVAMGTCPPNSLPVRDGVGMAPKTAPDRKVLRAALGLAESDILLCAPAEMVRFAGHKYAIWAHAILRQVFPHIRLLLPGGGTHAKAVHEFAASAGYADESPAGRGLSRADCLAAADIALFLAERDVGVGALAMAMSMGVPIVASNTPAMGQLLQDGRSALLAPPGHPRLATAAILRLIEDRSLAARLGDQARQGAADFQIPVVRQTLDRLIGAV